jgi:NADH dehydrogenase FAD-containing subunit
MKTFLILGAGTGGTMVANKMAKALDPNDWRIVIVDKDDFHYYQPGFCLFHLAYTNGRCGQTQTKVYLISGWSFDIS